MSLDPAGIQEECKQIFTYLTTAGSSTDRGASFMSGFVGDLSASRGEGLAARKLTHGDEATTFHHREA
jgi:hypothetical protein